jgi:hypothetical protein
MESREPSNPIREIDMTTNEKIARRKLSLLQLAQVSLFDLSVRRLTTGTRKHALRIK